MQNIAIICDKKQDDLIRMSDGETLRIKSHCEYLFPQAQIYIVSQAPRKKITFGKITYLDWSAKKFLSDYHKLNLRTILLFQNSHFSSLAYQFSKKRLPVSTIVDLYNPLIFEKLNQVKTNTRFLEMIESIKTIIESGDFFLCATETQKRYYLGVLSLAGKVRRNNFDELPLVVIPTNLGNSFNNETKEKKDLVFFGGLYPWFNINKIIDFTKRAVSKKYQVAFLGLQNPQVKGWYLEPVKKIMDTFSENKYIDFGNWTDYKTILKKLSMYKIAINIVPDGIEDELAYRTRLLTLLQCGVPFVTNGKDELSRVAIQAGVGFEYDKFWEKKNAALLAKKNNLSEKAISLYKKLVCLNNEEKNKFDKFILGENTKRKTSIINRVSSVVSRFLA
jgi:hypothetical protein